MAQRKLFGTSIFEGLNILRLRCLASLWSLLQHFAKVVKCLQDGFLLVRWIMVRFI